MSAPGESTQRCQCRKDHLDWQPLAEVAIDMHGCRTIYYCQQCTADLVDPLTEAVDNGAVLQCSGCEHAFLTVEQYLTTRAM